MALLTAGVRAATPADDAFLRRVFLDSRRSEFAGLPADQIDPLLALQYRAHAADRRARHPHAETAIILADDERVGSVTVDRDGGRMHLVDIAVLSSHRGRGIASEILGELVRTTEHATLTVWGLNTGARRLYERFGFQVVSEQFGYLLMATEVDG
ncbi:GNAT family N-acetyltransferase [Leifsonia naganoensis]|uniref:Ribosomal protein S18 acetylase RimI-like enzyme n=1 Tax=Leifsonia naganoensis TaxID=150025 RepID=A0A853DVK7_9MICO|nr:GNAT family N-acetyltransferase [Leifsonia naganoensis]NYK10240.1 ribosomal protein S18 acetylase RimI-like enzyme [Leifsonia naganoensis]